MFGQGEQTELLFILTERCKFCVLKFDAASGAAIRGPPARVLRFPSDGQGQVSWSREPAETPTSALVGRLRLAKCVSASDVREQHSLTRGCLRFVSSIPSAV